MFVQVQVLLSVRKYKTDMIKFPSIEQFRNVIREVKINHDYKGKNEVGEPIYLHDSPYPIIEFEGTVKLHGTNAGIVKHKHGEIEYQSRERVLSLMQDNAGFMLAMMNKDFSNLFNQYWYTDYIAIFGEWCGKGIQKGVAVSELDKMFVIFAVNVDGVWSDIVDCELPEGVYNINQFENYKLSIDFNNPELAQNTLIELTEKVEKECPVGKYFGVNGVGEGIVWNAYCGDRFYQFKVKGEKHSVSKVKTIASIDIEMVNSIKEFVDSVVNENRLRQGIENLNGAVYQTKTGDFLRWVVNDVMKEEIDTIVKNQLDIKKVNSAISQQARVWFFNHLNEMAIG